MRGLSADYYKGQTGRIDHMASQRNLGTSNNEVSGVCPRQHVKLRITEALELLQVTILATGSTSITGTTSSFQGRSLHNPILGIYNEAT